MTEPRLIWIHTPTRDGKMHGEHHDAVQALLDMARDGTSRGFSFGRRRDKGSPNIPRQRNWGCAKALMSGAEGILFVDSDIQFNPHEALDIFERPEDVIGVSHQTRARFWSRPPNMSGRFDWEGGKRPHFEPEEDLLRVAQPTTGFLYVKTSVLRRMIDAKLVRNYIAPNIEPEAWPFLFDFFVHQVNPITPHEGLAREMERVGLDPAKACALDGEDWDFARKCERIGVQMWIEPLNKLVHYEGSTGMDCDLHNFWVQHQTEFRSEYLAWLRRRAGRGCEKALAALQGADRVMAA